MTRAALRPAPSSTFPALRSRSFRLFWVGMSASNVGSWMQRVGQDWLVLQLSGGSGRAVGLAVGLQFLPFLLVAPLGGVLADRVAKRSLLTVTNAVSAVLAVVLGVLVVTGLVEIWHVFVLAFLLGCAAALDAPARQAFVSELVPREDLANAVGLNSATFHAARVVGPASAGLIIAWLGTAAVFAVNAVSFLAPLLALRAIRPRDVRVARADRDQRGLRVAVAVVRERPAVTVTLAVLFVVGTFGLNFQLTTALMAIQQFGVGAGRFGLLTSCLAVGAVTGALLVATRGRPSLRAVLLAAAGFGLAETLAGLMPSYWLFAASLVPVGLLALTFMTTAQALVQLSVPAATRGRVMALYSVLFIGGTPLGAPTIGVVADVLGPRWTVSGGGVLVIVGVAGAAWWARHRAVDVRAVVGSPDVGPAGPLASGTVEAWPTRAPASPTMPT